MGVEVISVTVIVHALITLMIFLKTDLDDEQICFYAGTGGQANSLKPWPCPNVTWNNYLTNSKHQHMCKKERSMAFKIHQNVFPTKA